LSGIAEFSRSLDQLGRLLTTWRAPRPPHRHDDRLSAKLFQRERCPSQVFTLEIDRISAILDGDLANLAVA
jgi:hypothetical protein